MPHKVDPTLRQLHADVYEALREFWLLYGRAPSKYELQRACRCSSTSIYNAERELKARNLITAQKFQSRDMRPTDMDLTISVEPPDPWAEVNDNYKFWAT